eukprot:228599-Rhodomonas_salina.1
MLGQYRTPLRIIRYLIYRHRLASYADSVPDSATGQCVADRRQYQRSEHGKCGSLVLAWRHIPRPR